MWLNNLKFAEWVKLNFFQLKYLFFHAFKFAAWGGRTTRLSNYAPAWYLCYHNPG